MKMHEQDALLPKSCFSRFEKPSEINSRLPFVPQNGWIERFPTKNIFDTLSDLKRNVWMYDVKTELQLSQLLENSNSSSKRRVNYSSIEATLTKVIFYYGGLSFTMNSRTHTA